MPALVPQDVVFLSGAGISVDGPTSGPIGDSLTRWAFAHAYLPETISEIQRAYEVLGMESSRLPRLEAVLEIAVRVHGIDCLRRLLSSLDQAQPNGLHRFFGDHIRLGGTHVTANFDALIERAVPGVDVLHFHGMLTPGGGDYAGLGARLSRIERGFDAGMQSRLDMAIGDTQRTLIVVGYSGSDYFDMDPFIQERASHLASTLKRVIWVNHDHRVAPGTFRMGIVDDTSPRMLRDFARAGVDCVSISCHTTALLSVLADQWVLPPVSVTMRTPSGGPPPRIGDEWLRAEATRSLYHHMGMHRSHADLLRRLPGLRDNVGDDQAAEIAWQEGRHTLALRHWRKVHSGTDPAVVARIQERVAACRWDRGSYLRAYAAATNASATARLRADSETIAATAELRARILIHMARTPDVRWFATRSVRRRVAEEIHCLLSKESFGVHTRVRLEDAAALLVDDPQALLQGRRGRSTLRPTAAIRVPAAPTSGAIDSYAQFEALSAMVDYRRGELRRAASRGLAVPVEWIEEYRAAADHLGKTAAVATLFAIPGAAEHYSLREVVALLPRVSATPWHRVRLLGSWLRHRRPRR